MELLSFDSPVETDVVRRIPTSAKVFVSGPARNHRGGYSDQPFGEGPGSRSNVYMGFVRRCCNVVIGRVLCAEIDVVRRSFTIIKVSMSVLG